MRERALYCMSIHVIDTHLLHLKLPETKEGILDQGDNEPCYQSSHKVLSPLNPVWLTAVHLQAITKTMHFSIIGSANQVRKMIEGKL